MFFINFALRLVGDAPSREDILALDALRRASLLLRSGLSAFYFALMDIGNLYEKLEADNKCVLMTGAISFPIAFLDCWKLSPAFREIDLIPQIILAIGIGFLLTMGGVLVNLLYLFISRISGELNAFVSLMPIMCSSIYAFFYSPSPLWVGLVFAAFFLFTIASAFMIRITAKHKKEKISDSHNDEH